IFREECDYLARRHRKLHIISIVAKPDGTDWTGPAGYLTADFIAASVPEIASRRVHLCGPPPMMDAVKAALAQLKVPAEQVKTEEFAPPKGGP
ncbi:FAD-binding oxidoreductase, partial [Pseudomonas sp. FW305-BF15]